VSKGWGLRLAALSMANAPDGLSNELQAATADVEAALRADRLAQRQREAASVLRSVRVRVRQTSIPLRVKTHGSRDRASDCAFTAPGWPCFWCSPQSLQVRSAR
jgi:hypothetical protein